jgi:hypothetical protein
MHAGAEAPTLSAASVRAIGVGLVRILLGVAVVAGAVARGLGGGPTVVAAVGGALVLALIAVGQRSRTGTAGFADALPVPTGARFDPAWLGVLLACIPSTVGVTVMSAVALVFSAALAALLGGVLLALGVLAVVAWMQLAARERREGARYWIERGPRPRLFVERSEAR